jgi:hypothetical protein
VYPVDNHTGDSFELDDKAQEQAFAQALRSAWDAGRAASGLDAGQEREQALSRADDLLPLYRFVNDPAYLRMLAEVNVHATMGSPSPEGYPRMWVAGWEIRNLRMVANVRKTFHGRPGARVLCIVGASHKPWFDGLLGQMQGVDLVDAERALD